MPSAFEAAGQLATRQEASAHVTANMTHLAKRIRGTQKCPVMDRIHHKFFVGVVPTRECFELRFG
jgi:hypothetical protein